MPKGKAKKVKKGKAAVPDRPPRKPLPPPACFGPDQLAQFKEMFKMFDEANIDKVQKTLIPRLFRKLGFNPTKAQLEELYETFLEDEFVDLVEYWEFLLMVERKVQWGDDFEAKIVESLKNLAQDDEETRVVDMMYLKEMLFTWGEPFDELEFKDWIKVAKKNKTYTTSDGVFKYETFVEKMNKTDVKFFPEPINYFKMEPWQLAALAKEKARLAAEEEARKEEERLARAEARRLRMIAAGLIMEEDDSSDSTED